MTSSPGAEQSHAGAPADGGAAELAGWPRSPFGGRMRAVAGGDTWFGRRRAILIPYGLISLLLVAAAIRTPGFVSPWNLSQQLVLASYLAVIAGGQTIGLRNDCLRHLHGCRGVNQASALGQDRLRLVVRYGADSLVHQS